MSGNAADKGFFANVATLVSGNLAARVLTLVLYPALTRLFAPEIFGIFAVIESVLVVLTSVCHLRFPMAILLPKEREEVDGLALAAFLSIAAFCLACEAVVLLFGPWLAAALKISDQLWLLHWVPATVLLAGGIRVLNQLSLRGKHFRGLALARVATTGGDRGLAVGLGLFGLTGLPSLLSAKIAGFLAAWGILGKVIGGPRLRALFARQTWTAARIMAARYRHFAFYSMTDLVLTGALQLPVILLMIGFSPATAAFFSLCRRVLAEPLNLLGQSLYRAYGERYAELQRNGESTQGFTTRFLSVLVDLSIIPLLLVALAGPEVFTLAFGARWALSGGYATLLGGFYMINFLSMPMAVLFDLKEQQRERLLYDLLFLAASALGLGVGMAIGDPAWAIGLFSLCCSAALLLRLRHLLRLAGLTGAGRIWKLLARVLPSLPLCLPLLIFKWYTASPWPNAIWAALALALHVALCIRRDAYLKEKLLQFLRKQ